MDKSDFERAAYVGKPSDYFDGSRQDMVDRLPADRDARILEIGCGNGSTGVLAKRQGKCEFYTGIEIDPGAAALASENIDLVLNGDVERMDFSNFGGPFDAVIVSEVLEHLYDPWQLLDKVALITKQGGLILASSPNIAFFGNLVRLFKGQFEYEEAGMMDRTHIRWFTPSSFRHMFEEAGFATLEAGSVSRPSAKWRLFNAITAGRLQHLSFTQHFYVGKRHS